MLIKEKFIDILEHEKEDEIVPFLKSLTKINCKEIKPELQKIITKYNTELRNNRLYLTKEQVDILQDITMRCFEYKDLENNTNFVTTDDAIKYVFPWYQPKYINQYLNKHYIYYQYSTVLELMDKGWFIPSKSYLAENIVYAFQDEISDIRAFEHFWYIFSYETNVYEYNDWIEKLIPHVNSGEIDRDRLLREALLTSNRGFNKPGTGWFCKLFTALEPTTKELLNLQEELFLSLSSPHSKPITDALKYIKSIHKEKSFNVDGFIDQIPLILSWEVKSIINNTLTLIDSLIKSYPRYKQELCLLTTNALNLKDESIQVKTLKILKKYKLLDDIEIQKSITLYNDLLFHSAKEMLPMSKSEETKEQVIPTSLSQIRDNNRMPIYESFDELLFYFSAVLMSEESYAVDLFLTNLPKLHKQITKDNISKLEPIFNNAFKSCYPVNFTQIFKGRIGGIFAYYLAKYGLILHNKFPIEGRFINDIYINIRFQKPTNEFLINDDRPIEELEKNTQSDEFAIIFHLLDKLLQKIETNIDIPFLCEPTHLPCYIEVSTFQKRLTKYKEQNITIDEIDLQIATERVIEKNTVSASMVVQDLTFEIIKKKYKKDKWSEWSDNNTRWITSLHFQANMTNKNDKNGIYHYFSTKNLGIITTVDIQRIMTLVPCNIHLLLASVIQTSLLYATFSERRIVNYLSSESGDIDLIHGSLKMLVNIWGNQHPTTYLFISTVMLYSDKISRDLASELWIKATNEGTMNQQLLGQTLGKLEHNEYAPLKRFTDLIVANMLNISTLHNKGLHTLLSNMITHMNDEPIKGTKKLLEIYLEVLSVTGLEVPHETMQKLRAWGEVKSLKSVLKKLNC